MEKVKRFFRELNENRKYQVVFFLVNMCVVLSGYFLMRQGVDKQIVIQPDDFTWVYQVDETEVIEGELTLSGFAFELNSDAKGKAFEIVLRNSKTGQLHFPKVKYTSRDEVNNYFLCEYNYSDSGFLVTLSENKLKLQENTFEILLRMSDKKKSYSTGTYIFKGKIMYTDPQEYMPLDVEGTEIEEIVADGKLRVYRPDFGMYVYQYEDELYWIAEQDYNFNENNSTRVQYQIGTTQVEKLPKERQEGGWNWDNLNFGFTHEELLNCDTGVYRVAKKKLPVEYSITKIWTGDYDKDWVWQQYFRPYYEFN